MRAALIEELGAAPRPVDLDGPVGDGEIEIEIAAVSLNPIDVAIGAGTFYGGHPDPPYIPCVEAAGRTPDGALVYLHGDGRGLAKPGFLCQRVRVPARVPLEVPGDAPPHVVAAVGVAGLAAWGAVELKAQVGPGDRVLVLGASGAVGQIALQVAKLLGAERVVAAGRSRERLRRAAELGADEIVELDDADALADAFGGEGFTVCIDPVWGWPLAQALPAAAPGARIVNVGASAGPEASLPSPIVRSRELVIRGHTNFAMAPEDRRRLLFELLDGVESGRLAIDIERHRLDDVAAAWERQRAGAGAKLVIEL